MVELVKAKYSGQRIAKMVENEDFEVTTRAILARISAATGWAIPDNDFMRNAIIKEFTLYCAENCKDMTPDEMLYAVRNYGLEVQDWGKAVNLQLINEPISLYRSAREELSRLEEQIDKPKEIEQRKDVDWSDTWEKLISDDLTGLNSHLVSWASIYDWIEKSGYLCPTEAEKWEWVQEAREKTIIEIKNKREAYKATQEEKELSEMLKVPTWHKNPRAVKSLIATSKRIGVERYINKLKQGSGATK